MNNIDWQALKFAFEISLTVCLWMLGIVFAFMVMIESWFIGGIFLGFMVSTFIIAGLQIADDWRLKDFWGN